jgi:hypothetical protein
LRVQIESEQSAVVAVVAVAIVAIGAIVVPLSNILI